MIGIGISPFSKVGGGSSLAPFALIANVGTAGSSNGGTTAAANTTGAKLIVISAHTYGSGPAETVSDSKGNVWTALTVRNGSVGGGRARLYYSINPTVGTGHTFTIAGGLIYGGLEMMAFSAGGTVSFDVENGAGAGAVSTIQTGSVTPASNNSLIISDTCWSSSATASINLGFTITNTYPFSGGNNEAGASSYLIQTTASAVNPTWTYSSSTGDRAAVIAVFKNL